MGPGGYLHSFVPHRAALPLNPLLAIRWFLGHAVYATSGRTRGYRTEGWRSSRAAVHYIDCARLSNCARIILCYGRAAGRCGVRVRASVPSGARAIETRRKTKVGGNVSHNVYIVRLVCGVTETRGIKITIRRLPISAHPPLKFENCTLLWGRVQTSADDDRVCIGLRSIDFYLAYLYSRRRQKKCVCVGGSGCETESERGKNDKLKGNEIKKKKLRRRNV